MTTAIAVGRVRHAPQVPGGTQAFDFAMALSHFWTQAAHDFLRGLEQIHALQLATVKQIERDLNRACVAADQSTSVAELAQLPGRVSMVPLRHVSEHVQKMFILMLGTGLRLSNDTQWTGAELMNAAFSPRALWFDSRVPEAETIDAPSSRDDDIETVAYAEMTEMLRKLRAGAEARAPAGSIPAFVAAEEAGSMPVQKH
jgi:hypothetical protein